MTRAQLALPTPLKSRVKIARARAAAAVGSERWQWPALHELDRKMVERLPESGTFLEIGGNDGYTGSNTWNLERHRGWVGILVEPLPSAYEISTRARRNSVVYNYACVGPDGPSSLTLVDRGPMAVGLGLLDRDEEVRRVGGVERKVEAQTTTLSALIDRSPFDLITFMVIDVEGAEMHVLAGLDLVRHTPDFLLIETDKLDEVTERLAGHMRYVEPLSHHDYLFTRV